MDSKLAKDDVVFIRRLKMILTTKGAYKYGDKLGSRKIWKERIGHIHLVELD